jgi:23S rRNA pseudouridine2605 synthase
MSSSRRPRVQAPSILSGEQRINKLLAAAGLGSRRQVDELITEGRVEIDGKTVTQVGVKVDADKVKVTVDGEPLKRHRPQYFAVHKPAGVLCTNRDPEGRPRVIDLVPGFHRLFPVGRLDASSTGLILLTNDGELAQQLAHPKHSVPKEYFVVVAGQVEPEAMRRLQRGIYLAEGLARVDGAKIRKVRKGCTEIDMILSEGKNREIRRVLARLGHRVVTLRRVGIGPLRLGDMPEGAYRPLTPDEIAKLYKAVDEIKKAKKAERKERDKRRASEMEQVMDSTEPKKERKTDKAIANKKSVDGKKKPAGIDSDATRETLPSLADNPYRMDDDDDNVVDPGYENSVLVRNHGPLDEELDEGTRRGKVLGYSDDDQEDDEFDATGMGAMVFDTEDEDFDDADGLIEVSGGFEEFGSDGEDMDEAAMPDQSPREKSPWSNLKKPGQPRQGGRSGRPNRQRSESGDRATGDRATGERKPRGRAFGGRGTGGRKYGLSRDGAGSSNEGQPRQARGPRASGPRSSSSRSGAPKAGAPKAGGPRTGAPRTGGNRSGASGESTSRGGPSDRRGPSSGPRSSGPSRGGRPGGPKGRRGPNSKGPGGGFGGPRGKGRKK